MKHPTQSPLSFVLHSLVSLFVAALGAGATFAIQQIGSGHFSLTVLITGALGSFAAYFGAGFIMLEKNPQVQSAASQIPAQVASSIDNLSGIVGNHSGFIGALGKDIQDIKAFLAPLYGQVPASDPRVQRAAISNAAAQSPVPTSQNVPQQDFSASSFWTQQSQAVQKPV